MPDLDGGHYFLTALAPIRTETIGDKTPGMSHSHLAQLAQKLALLATGQQTATSPADAWASPFARNSLNHMARFVIIEGPAYNGRVAGDTLREALAGVDPLEPQPVDRFDHPYLLFAADIDAQETGESALRVYTDALWDTMRHDLEQIFNHCIGFAGVSDAAGFNAYISRCQVETSMPFNDYWAHDQLKDMSGGAERLRSLLPRATALAKPLALVAALWLVALFAFILLAAFGTRAGARDVAEWLVTWLGLGFIGLGLVAATVTLLAYRWIAARGRRPFPTAPGGDLPTILKALYLQQHFTRFAIETQGLDEATLHARFGEFLTAHRPESPEPRQAPGAHGARPTGPLS